jgi:hypothetical protein
MNAPLCATQRWMTISGFRFAQSALCLLFAPGANRRISIDSGPRFSYKARISLTSGTSTGDSRWMGRVRFLRAGLVTPLPGGLGIVPAGITPGARGAPLKRD